MKRSLISPTPFTPRKGTEWGRERQEQHLIDAAEERHSEQLPERQARQAARRATEADRSLDLRHDDGSAVKPGDRIDDGRHRPW